MRTPSEPAAFSRSRVESARGPRLMRFVLIALLALAVQASSGPADARLGQLLARAGEQVRRFEQDFALVISDEDYQQHAQGRYFVGPVHRRTRAEMLFLWLP